jgi:hypothetical protein
MTHLKIIKSEFLREGQQNCISIAKTHRLMVFKEINLFHPENISNSSNTPCAQNEPFYGINTGGT